MLKLFKKTDDLLKDLAYELDLYADELQDDGYVEIEHFTGYHAKQGYDYDLMIRLYSDADDEAVNFHYFSATVASDDVAESNIKKVEDLLISNNVTFNRTFK